MRNILDKLNSLDRMKIFRNLFIFLIFLLIFQLFRITIIEGGKFRKLADSRRVKDVVITAQRGNIRDKNGIILAGNRPVFTVQLRKDELEKVDTLEKNTNFLKLTRYLQEDGVSYLNDFPIQINTFTYTNIQDFLGEDEPSKIVYETLLNEELLRQLINTNIRMPYEDHYSYSIKGDVIRILGFNDNDEGPVIFKDGHYIYRDENMAKTFKKNNDLGMDSDFETDVISLVMKKPTTLRVLLENPIARQEAYNLLASKGLISGIKLREVSNIYTDKYIRQKAKLMKLSSKITWKSSAEEDFKNLLVQYSLENLLTADKEKDQNKSSLELAYKFLEKKEPDLDLFFDKKSGNVFYKSDHNKNALNIIMKKLVNEKYLGEFLSVEDMRTRAQSQLIKDGINPGISLANEEYKYTQLRNAEDLFKRYSLKLNDGDKKLFNTICSKNKLNKNLSIYEKRGILNLYDSVERQGNYAYIPVNFAYEVSNKTVAKIEENLPMNKGIEISIEPIRSYPLGESSSHILGYIGNIAMEKEIKKYIEEKGYDRNTLIGKTGIEEVKESELKGTNGYRKVTVDSLGNTTDIIEEISPVPGKDVKLTIDIDLQQKAEQILEKSLSQIRSGGTFESPWGNYNYITSKDKGRPYSQATSGAVVVVDVNNGNILTMANYPQYNPNLFAKGINPMDWESLKPEHEDDLLAPRPLYNIAMQSAIQPGSIFKMVTGLAALEKGLDPNLKIQDGGFVEFNGHKFGCWLWNQKREVHGKEDLANAIKDSCNYYFYSLALGKDQKTDEDIGVKVSAKDISSMAEKFGLGERTGIEIMTPQEVKGTRPDPSTKYKILKSLLERHLENNIKQYYVGEENLSREKEKELTIKVLSLLDVKKNLTRPEVYDYLKNLDLNPDALAKKERMPFVDVLKYTYLDQVKWKISDTMNITIGQGENSYTPLQMARYTMALANGGNLYELRIIDDVINPSNKWEKNSNISKNHKVELTNADFYNEIKKGMKYVAKSGVNKNLFEKFPVEVAMKTGSAERSGINPYTKDTYDSFAWEVAFAPADKPEIAVCVVIFQGGTGANAGPILQTVLAEYFGLNKEVKVEKLPIETELSF